VHTTGHAQADEIKTLLSIVRPEHYVPIHGEYRHLVANGELAVTMGVSRDKVLIASDGDALELDDSGLSFAGRVPSNYLFVDGIVGDVGHGVLRDRRVLAEEGVVVVIVTVDEDTNEVVGSPEIITRGWVHATEAEDLLDDACDVVADAAEAALRDGIHDIEGLERSVRRAAGRFVNERTKRRPMIVPVVIAV
jgi:ribonuclease J